MKNKNKLILALTIVTTLPCIAFLTKNNVKVVDSEVHRYHITMNKDKNKLHPHTERGTSYDGETVVKTELGNDVLFSYNDVLGASNTWHILDASTGSFQNIDPIHGLELITITSQLSGEYTIYWANDKDFTTNVGSVTNATDSNTSYYCNFNNNYPDYFKIVNTGDSKINIEEIRINLLCYKTYSNLTIESSDEQLGTVSGQQGTFVAGQLVTISALPKIGVSFLGWFEEEKLISTSPTYEFFMTEHDVHYVARFEYAEYFVNIDLNDSSMGYVEGAGAYNYNQEVILNAIPFEGNAFFGWYEGETLLSQKKEYSFKMPLNNMNISAKFVKSYKLSINSDDPTKGNVLGPTECGVGLPVTVTANAFDGYALDRWEDELYNIVSEAFEYTFIMPDRDVELWAVFDKGYKLTVNSNNELWGTVSGSGSYIPGKNVTASATGNLDYFGGWFDGDKFVNFSNDYAFVMPEEDVSLTAKFISENHNGVEPVYNSDANTILYGLYPQTHVKDNELINILENLENTSENGWYFYDGNYFTKEIATTYKDGYYFEDGTPIIEGNAYWFKCEPIKWEIITENSYEYFLVSSVLLDYRVFSASNSSDYEKSDIRKWLNNEFYNSAFALDCDNIIVTHVDNSAATTRSTKNPFICNDTYDNVLLLSYKDHIDSKKAGRCKATDYVKALGAKLDDGYISYGDFKYSAAYWTRTPDYLWREYVDIYQEDGTRHTNNAKNRNCIRPAITLKVF